MLKRLKKELAQARKAKRLAQKNQLRQAHNREQVKLILEGLEERGY